MKIQLYSPGRTEPDFIRNGVEFYQKRISQWGRFEIIETPRPKSGKLTKSEYMKSESDALLRHLPSQNYRIILDEQGKPLTSPELADNLQKWSNNAPGGIAFICGGAYGLSKEILQTSDFTFSLSVLTFPPQLVRLILAEQVYRALSILHNHPYHH
jgi:23S rRNA (pseudouridine1915-N3)-methyltransferase